MPDEFSGGRRWAVAITRSILEGTRAASSNYDFSSRSLKREQIQIRGGCSHLGQDKWISNGIYRAVYP